MIRHLFKGFKCTTSRLNREKIRMGFREFQKYLGLSAVPHIFCLPSLLSLHPPHHALCQGLHQQAALPSGFQLYSAKDGGTGRRRRGRRAKSWCLFPSRVTLKFSALVRWPCPYSFLCLWVSITSLSHGFFSPRSRKRTYCYKPQVLYNPLWFTCTVPDINLLKSL